MDLSFIRPTINGNPTSAGLVFTVTVVNFQCKNGPFHEAFIHSLLKGGLEIKCREFMQVALDTPLPKTLQ